MLAVREEYLYSRICNEQILLHLPVTSSSWSTCVNWRDDSCALFIEERNQMLGCVHAG